MGSEITIYTGCQGEENTINIDWFDHNGVHKTNKIQANILGMDKPRTLEIIVDDEVVKVVKSEHGEQKAEFPCHKCRANGMHEAANSCYGRENDISNCPLGMWTIPAFS